jgi:hypothetical protein
MWGLGDLGVACGPCYSLIRAQALGARPVSAPIANAADAKENYLTNMKNAYKYLFFK